MEISTLTWIVGAVAWLSIGAYVLWIIGPVWKDGLVRCPRTGSVTLVGFRRVAGQDGNPRFRIVRCGLWPEHRMCDRGCARHLAEPAATLGFHRSVGA